VPPEGVEMGNFTSSIASDSMFVMLTVWPVQLGSAL